MESTFQCSLDMENKISWELAACKPCYVLHRMLRFASDISRAWLLPAWRRSNFIPSCLNPPLITDKMLLMLAVLISTSSLSINSTDFGPEVDQMCRFFLLLNKDCTWVCVFALWCEQSSWYSLQVELQVFWSQPELGHPKGNFCFLLESWRKASPAYRLGKKPW